MSYEHDEELARLRAEVETLRAQLAEKDVLLRRAVGLANRINGRLLGTLPGLVYDEGTGALFIVERGDGSDAG